MSKPNLQKPEAPERRGGSWLGILLSIFLCGGALVGISFLTVGLFGPAFLVVVAVLFLIVVVHYAVWGCWLSKVIQQAADEEEESAG